MYNYAAQFIIPADSICVFAELEQALRSHFEHDKNGGNFVKITKNDSDINLDVQGWRIYITLDREPWDDEQYQRLAAQSGDEAIRQKILTNRERWNLTTDADEQDRYYNYFQLTCDVIRTLCSGTILYDPTLGEFT